jgi:hypothetical protein
VRLLLTSHTLTVPSGKVLRQELDSPKVETRCKVGARRTAELCFPTPPSEPDVQVSKHPALQGLATSASSVTTGLVRFVAFTAAPFPVGPNFIEHKAVIRPEPRQSPGPLRHVRGFPALRLLWGLRRCVWTLVDSTPSHSMHSLPRSQ